MPIMTKSVYAKLVASRVSKRLAEAEAANKEQAIVRLAGSHDWARKLETPKPAQPTFIKETTPAPKTTTRKVPEIETEGLDKKRVRRLTFSLSEEEEALIRAYVKENDLSLSSWVREVIFDRMARRIPKRSA